MSGPRRRFLAPEVVQTSAMDCGPASLKCLLEGFGIGVSYGRLREACQTDVDGTSIDTLEGIARQLGLDAEQIMLPPEHLLLDEAQALPALVVLRLPSGMTHFVVAWARRGPLVQVMDPAVGRQWRPARAFFDELYRHTMPVPAAAWREWAASDEAVATMAARLRALGVRLWAPLLERARGDPSWVGLAALEAAIRMAEGLVDGGAVPRGAAAGRLVEGFAARAAAEPEGELIPHRLWSVRPAPAAEDGTPQLLLTGAVLVRIAGRRAGDPRVIGDGEAPLPGDLAAALAESPARPARELLGLLGRDGALAPAVIGLAVVAAAAGGVGEALLLRALFDVHRELAVSQQRLGALAALLLFAAALTLLELPLAGSLLRLGRHLEIRVRTALLAKLPRLGDRYFASRPVSDMAERSHSLVLLRHLPELGGQLLRTGAELVVTTAGLCWLDPASAPLAITTALLGLTTPLLIQPALTERDLRVRTHGGALSRFYLDAMLGLVAVRTHGAEPSLRREHEALLTDWSRASRSFVRAAVVAEALQALLGVGLSIALVAGYARRTSEPSGILLLLYWALHLPLLGQQLAQQVRLYPAARNVVLRLLELLMAPGEGGTTGPALPAAAADGGGAAIELRGVDVVIGGHPVISGAQVTIPGGSHVAVVGPSGAGKSSLVGLLLGFHRPAAGELLVDGAPWDAAARRHEIAWVDPAVQLWNRTLLDNLRYGLAPSVRPDFARLLEEAELYGLLAGLPDGLQSVLGEGGGLVSGGEGQRVRLGRAFARERPRLVIFDEPFRGLDRERRRSLLARARGRFADATFLCITHDVGDTAGFPRVLVIDGGRIVEDDAPRALAERPDSLFRALVEAEDEVREGLWASPTWRRVRLDGGAVVETARRGEE